MKEFAQVFEDLIRRMLAPATAFVVLFFLVHIIDGVQGGGLRVWNVQIQRMTDIIGHKVGALLIIMVGMSYILSTLQQIFFDNRLRKSFSPWYFERIWTWDMLKDPRDKVKSRFKDIASKDGSTQFKRVYDALNTAAKEQDKSDTPYVDDPSWEDTVSWKNLDFVLYEILGGIDKTSTKGFVNDAKAFGIVITSAILALWTLVISHEWALGYVLIACLASMVLWLTGYSLVRTQYRIRALRLYVNFLAMPDEKIAAILRDYKTENDGAAPSQKVEKPLV